MKYKPAFCLRAKTLHRYFVWSLLPVGMVVALGALWSLSVGAASITQYMNVDTTADEQDTNPGDGVCVTASGKCSLRAAIQEANALQSKPSSAAVPIVITLTDVDANPATVEIFTLNSLATNEADDDVASKGDLDVTGIDVDADGKTDISIVGRGITAAGEGLSVIQAAPSIINSTHRVFDFHGDNNVELKGVTIRHGFVANGNGGGIRNLKSWLTIKDSEIISNGVNNQSGVVGVGSGGGIYNGKEGTVTLINSAIGKRIESSNTTYANFAGDVNNNAVAENNNTLGYMGGGGVWNAGTFLVEQGSRIEYNTARPNGGGVENAVGARLEISNSFVRYNSNSVLYGGGISNHGGDVRIKRSIIAKNIAATGAGIFNDSGVAQGGGTILGGTVDGQMSITESLVTENEPGGGIVNYAPGLVIEASTISLNKAGVEGARGNSPYGGGVLNIIRGAASISNSTIARNKAITAGGGILNSRFMTLTNVTLADNSSPIGTEIFLDTSDKSATPKERLLTVKNTIIGGNAASINFCRAGDPQGVHQSIAATEASFRTGGYNLENGISCGLKTTSGDIVNANPLVAALANNGGIRLPDLSTLPTMQLQPGSAAIGAGACDSGFDQRAYGRPGANAQCDIGAVESDGVENPPRADLLVTLGYGKQSSSSPVQSGETLTYRVTVTNLGPETVGPNSLKAVITLPVNVRMLPVVVAGWLCTQRAGSSTLIDCAYDKALDSGASLTIFPDVIVPGSLMGSALTTTVTVSATSPADPIPGNNTATISNLVLDTGGGNTPATGSGTGAFAPLSTWWLALPAIWLARRRVY